MITPVRVPDVDNKIRSISSVKLVHIPLVIRFRQKNDKKFSKRRLALVNF